MKKEVQKILEMSKSGTITDEQAALLLEELSRPTQDRASEGSGQGNWRWRDSARIAETVAGAISEWIPNKTFASEGDQLNDNLASMSKVIGPSGESYEFKGNSIKMSHLSDLRLLRSELCENVFNMSKVVAVQLKDSQWKRSKLTASHVDGVELDQSEMIGLKAGASKIVGLTLSESVMHESNMDQSHVREVALQKQTRCENFNIIMSHVKGLLVVSSEVSDFDTDVSKIFGVRVEQSQWNRVLFRMLKANDLEFVGTQFNDVLFSGEKEGLWKKCEFNRVRFENVKLSKALFSLCRWKNVTLKNIDLTEQKIVQVDLSDVTIDGNEQFLSAIGKKT